MFARKTVAWYNDILLGPVDLLQDLMNVSINLKNKGYIGSSNELEIEISNVSDANLMLENTSNYQFHNQSNIIVLDAQSIIKLNLITKSGSGDLSFDVVNAIGGADKYPQVIFPIEN